MLRSRIHALPGIHRASLGALLWHLSRIISHSNKNGMDSKNLASIFAPLVFGDDENLQGGLNGQSLGQSIQVRRVLLSISDTYVSQDSVMETLIDNAHILLDECHPASSSSIYPRARAPMMDDHSSATSTMVSFPRLGGPTLQHSPTQSPGSTYASSLSTPPMSPSGSSVYEDLSGGGHTPTQAAPAPLLPQLPDFPRLRIFTETAGSEPPVRLQVFPCDAVGIDVADPTPNLRPQPAGSIYTLDRSNLYIARPRSAIDSLGRRSPAQATLRPLTPDISSSRIFKETLESSSQEQDVTLLAVGNTNVGERSRYPSEVSLVPSLPQFAHQRQRRPPPISIPETESNRTTITDYHHSSATSLASRDFTFPGSFNDS